MLAGCPETVGQSCPPSSYALGQYSLSFAVLDAGSTCTLTTTTDAGSTTGPLAASDGGQQTATICAGDATDGGGSIYLVVPGKGSRKSDLLPDAGFSFVGHTDPTSGSACICAIAIDETFSGRLTGAWDGGVPAQPDGGLPPITGLSGSLVDQLTTPGTGCACNVPCAVTYTVTGTRF